MNSLSSPMEAILSAAQTVLGRAFLFAATCSAAATLGVVINARHSLDAEWLPGLLLKAAVVAPVAFVSLFIGWGLLVYPFCLALAIAFIRLELSFKWLLLPAILITADTALLSMR